MCKKLLIYLFFSFILYGCSANYYGKGEAFLKIEEYDQAIENLSRAVNQNPKKAENWRELGIAYYKKGELDGALGALRQANLIKPEHKTIFYLGLVYEKKGDPDSAIDAYKGYMILKARNDREKEFKEKVKVRIRILNEKKIAAKVRESIDKEDSLDVAAIPLNTVAVTYFDATGLDSSLTILSKGLAEFLTTDLSKVKKLTVVERLRLEKLLEELRFSGTQYVDPYTAPRIGRLLGAYRLVTGSILSADLEKLRVDGALVITETGEISLSPEETLQARLADLGYYHGKIDGIIGPLTKVAIKAFQRDHGLKADGIVGPKTLEEIKKAHTVSISTMAEFYKIGTIKKFFELEKELAFEIIEKMGIELTKEERDDIKEVPTENFLAILAYCRGLDYMDRGMYQEAKAEFDQARLKDPDFDEAEDKFEEVTDILEHRASVENLLDYESAYVDATEVQPPVSDPLGERLSQTNEHSSLIQNPSVDNPYTQPPAPTGTVIIEGNLR